MEGLCHYNIMEIILRLWYRKRSTKSVVTVSISYLDTIPKHLNPGEKHPKFESLPTVIDGINTRLRQFPLQGNFNLQLHNREITVLVASICLSVPNMGTKQLQLRIPFHQVS